ncbi:Phage terminase large subunit (GpA) [Metalysinibacillus saudimassiliensis]|uniref:Phage terminase large subunit (GpA) n=1 Tax=Metalysinibacillus saudimassiliensis TaxID=1461583 RepID=A0A078MHJ3_9BACL|nr:Phage terminase large subunit (GpA) [Metalysinibacillus saudimassiliensis]
MVKRLSDKSFERTSDLFKRIAKQALMPPPKLTVSEWADEHRRLSSEASAESGRWRTSRAEYQREIMDAINDPYVEDIVIMASAQVGKSEIILNGLGYYIHYDPSPILLIQPTEAKAKDFSKERVAPMIRDSPALSERVGGFRSKDSSNTILFKSFPGGFIALGGANAPAGLAARPIRIVLADEIDRFPVSAGEEGDPLDLAEKRTTAFYNRKKIKVSTPTIKGASRIEMEFNLSSKEYYNLPCPRCGEYQPLKWEQIDFETECHRCEHCGYLSDEFDWKNQKGKWVATAESKMRGFHLNELLSPFRRWGEIIADFKKAKRKGTEALKVFKNTSLGETWEEEGTALDEETFVRRQEVYEAEVPDGVKILTAAVDTQDDRFEIEVVGWGLDKESWGIQYHVIHGDLHTPGPWQQLDEFLSKRFEKADGRKFAIACTLIDSGGHFTQEVYKFTKPRLNRGIYAIKGESSQMSDYTPLIAGYSKPKPIEAVLVKIGVNEGKVSVLSALQVDKVGPNYCHFPKGKGYSAQYFRTLTAERLETVFVGGLPKQRWKQIRARNEGFDLRVYNTAALEILNPNLEKEYPADRTAVRKRRRRRR